MRAAALLVMVFVVAGCGAVPATSAGDPVPSAPPGPRLHGRVVGFSPSEHSVVQSTGQGPSTAVTADAAAAGLSPDLRTLAYVTQDGKLVLRNVADGSEHPVTFAAGGPTGAGAGCLSWSPDGQRLAFFGRGDKGLYVTTTAGAVTRVDLPKHDTYQKGTGRLFDKPDPAAPTYVVASQLTCGQWLDARRLVFDRLAAMPAAVTVDPSDPGADLPPDTTTVAVLDPLRLVDSPDRWSVEGRCGTHILTLVDHSSSSTAHVVDVQALGDDRLAQAGALAPDATKLPVNLASAFVAGSCDVLLIGQCVRERCPAKRYELGTGTMRDLAAVYSGGDGTPRLGPDTVWNPAGTQYAVNSFGGVSIYDLSTGNNTYVLDTGKDGRLLGWLPS